MTNEIQNAWDMALTLASNVCVNVSDRYNDDDEIEKADAATECAKQIRVGIGQYPEEWQKNNSKVVVDEEELDKMADDYASKNHPNNSMCRNAAKLAYKAAIQSITQ